MSIYIKASIISLFMTSIGASLIALSKNTITKVPSSPQIVLKKSPPPIDFMKVPNFVNQRANYIHYPEQLASFWAKLKALKQGKKKQIHILHIGDSHLQGDILTGEIRKLFHHDFGNAGRGLVFPYQIAKTNAPRDIQSASTSEWVRSRNIDHVSKTAVGICGYSVSTNDPNFELHLTLKNTSSFFDQVTVFGSQKINNYEVGLDNAYLQQQRSTASCFQYHTPQQNLVLRGKKTAPEQDQFNLQGLLLKSSTANGIIYSSVGVNGATYMAYNKAVDFIPQLKELELDLIIISLGTNEAANRKMRISWVQDQAEKLIQNIQKYSTCESILLVTPPDIYIGKKYRTYNGAQLAEMMHDLSKMYSNIAIWDFYQVMGGYGSIPRWVTEKLATKDYIHYTAKGYQLQGQLLYKAMMQYFNQL